MPRPRKRTRDLPSRAWRALPRMEPHSCPRTPAKKPKELGGGGREEGRGSTRKQTRYRTLYWWVGSNQKEMLSKSCMNGLGRALLFRSRHARIECHDHSALLDHGWHRRPEDGVGVLESLAWNQTAEEDLRIHRVSIRIHALSWETRKTTYCDCC